MSSEHIAKAKAARRAYGWQPDVPDQRDHTSAAPLVALAKRAPLPAKLDLRSKCPPVYDQGNIGGCTANAIVAAIEFDRPKQKLADFISSRFFIDHIERAVEHTVATDSSAQIRDRIKRVARKWACPEKGRQHRFIVRNSGARSGAISWRKTSPTIFGRLGWLGN